MKKHQPLLFAGLLVVSTFFTACNNQPTTQSDKTDTAAAAPKLKEEDVTYVADTATLNGYVVYDESTDKKRPVVLVVHEWWGLTDYPKTRARELAQLGYLAMAVDMFGNGKTVDNPDAAGKMAAPFYTNAQMAKARIDAALGKIKTYPQADTNNMAAIGYCFGGAMVLNTAKLGSNLKGVVSFHGNLAGVPPNKDSLKAKILVCHGETDKFVSQQEVAQFKKQMDSIGADYSLKIYPGATHAFTNPAATEKGKQFNIPIAYNAAADSASWSDMRHFFDRLFR